MRTLTSGLLLALLTTGCAEPTADPPGPGAAQPAPAVPAAPATTPAAPPPLDSTAAPPPDTGQQPGSFIAAEDTWDGVHEGVHLVLTYDEGLGAFSGMVTNDTDTPMCGVEVEAVLENGPTLGPSPAVDLEPGAGRPVEILTGGEPVQWWGAASSFTRCG